MFALVMVCLPYTGVAGVDTAGCGFVVCYYLLCTRILFALFVLSGIGDGGRELTDVCVYVLFQN